MSDILEYIKGDRVFYIELSDDKTTVEITENCDQYFSVNLTKKQFGELIDELNAIKDMMV